MSDHGSLPTEERLDAQAIAASAPGRGRDAASPRQIPWRGWKDVSWRVLREIFDDQIPILAGSVAFFATLSVFPLLIALISLYGLWADPVDVAHRVSEFSVALPWGARTLLIEQMVEIAKGSSAKLGLGLVMSLSFTLLSAAGGIEALITGINTAYDERETRSWLKLRFLALKFTLAFIAFLMVALLFIAVLPPLLDALGIAKLTRVLAIWLRWPALALLMTLALSVLYRNAPNRRPPKWRWVSWGAAFATLIWVLASLGLSLYVAHFGSFNRTYGTLGGIMGLSLWLYVSSLAILIGAELNAELEHQTAIDSTIGPDRPMGERQAVVADNLGKLRAEP